MIRRNGFMVILTIAMLSMVGCGKNSSIVETENEVCADSITDIQGTNQRTPETEKATVNETNTYAKSPEWEQYGQADCAIQIRDMFFHSGMTVGDAINVIENSAEKYEYSDELHGDANEIVPYGSWYFTVRQDGQEVFRICYRALNDSYTDHDLMAYANGEIDDQEFERRKLSSGNCISSCVVLWVEINEEYKEDCRFINGTPYNEFLQMNEEELMDFAEMNFIPCYRLDDFDNIRDGSSYTAEQPHYGTLRFWYDGKDHEYPLNGAEWTGKSFMVENVYSFDIDRENNRVTDCSLPTATGMREQESGD